jgi:Protein of unknwon function (DUF3310)
MAMDFLERIIMTKTYYEKFIAGKDKPIMGSGADREWKEDEDAVARWDELRTKAWSKPHDALDKQIGGNHYANMKIQPVEFITANNLTFLEGNVVKYISRHHAKNGADDVKKAIHYCELILKTVYGQ